MAVYHGVVKDNRVELEGNVRLTDGVRVEVHTGGDDTAARADEKNLIRRLRAEGLIEEPPVGAGEDDEEFEPVVVQGEPLSEQIIRERR